jgi:hypothetical protein
VVDKWNIPSTLNQNMMLMDIKAPRSKVKWNWSFLLVNSFKLVLRPLDKDLGPRQIKLWFNLHGIILKGKPIGLDQK